MEREKKGEKDEKGRRKKRRNIEYKNQEEAWKNVGKY